LRAAAQLFLGAFGARAGAEEATGIVTGRVFNPVTGSYVTRSTPAK
jgi:hypothetical protein